MPMPLLLAFLFLLFGFGTESIFAQTAEPTSNDITIEGQEVDYDHALSHIFATGNVALSYHGSTLNAQIFRYSLIDKQLQIPGAFHLDRDGHRLDAADLNYDLGTRIGQATHFKAHLEPWYVVGDRIDAFPDYFIVNNATLTTCDLPNTPHFYIQSEKVKFYPKLGVFTAINNNFYHHLLPGKVWIPSYTHNAAQKQGNTPFPIFGNSTREGGYVKEYISYLLDPSQMGNIHIGYATRLGVLSGFSHHISLTTDQLLSLSLSGLGADGMGGGVEFRQSFRQMQPAKNSGPDPRFSWMNTLFLPLSVLTAPEESYWDLKWTYGELNSDFRLDHRPDLDIRLRPWQFGDTGISVQHTGQVGLLGEKSLDQVYTQSFRAGLLSVAERGYAWTPSIDLWANLTHDGRWYEREKRWQRLYAQLGIRTCEWANPSLWWTHFIKNSGESPFESERQFAIQHDEIGFSVSHKGSSLSTRFEGRYDTITRTMVVMDAQLDILFHCWTTILKWRLTNGAISGGVGLSL